MTPLIPYSRQCLDDDDIAAVVDVLRSPMLTTGPQVELFEQELAAYLGAKHVVAVNSGTAALHLAVEAHVRQRGYVAPGFSVLVPTWTFVATANAVVMAGGVPALTDVARSSMLMRLVEGGTGSPRHISVDTFGAPSDEGDIVDAAHSLGAKRDWSRGTFTLSLHPVKTITTGEGGAIVTDNGEIAERCRLLRSHGRRDGQMVELGFNYRMSDIAAALGRSQLRKADAFVAQRRTLARSYLELLAPLVDHGHLTLPTIDVERSAWHLFPALFADEATRGAAIVCLAQRGFQTQVHYPPVHLQPYYQQRFGYREGMFPVAEDLARRELSLPLWPGLTTDHVADVASTLTKFFAHGGGH